MPWNPRDSTLKVKTFELLTRHRELKPDEWAILAGFHPVSSAWSYLRRQYKHGYLRRRRDPRGRIVYQLGPNGARYLLWWKQKFPDAKVAL